MEGKVCSKCGEFKSYSEFYKRKVSKDGYRGECKQCMREYKKQYYYSHKEERKQYYESHKDEIKEKKKQYYESNKDEIKKYKKQYYNSHKDEINEKKKQYNASHKEEIKQYYESHKEERKEYSKQYYESNKDEIKQYYESHKDEIKNYHKQYYESNKDEINEKSKQYYQGNKDKNIKVINDIIKNIEKYNLINKYNIPIYGYIYKIENIKTGRVYIGQTIIPITKRYKLNIIDGWLNERLKYDKQKFKDEIINIDDFKLTEILDVGICHYHLDKLETYYINLYDSYNNGYNNNNGNHNTDDGIEEFKEILQYYNINESELIWGN